MTTEHVSVPRDEFEKWMIEEMGYPRADLYFASARNCYRSYHVHLAWKAWEQAILSRATPSDVCKTCNGKGYVNGWGAMGHREEDCPDCHGKSSAPRVVTSELSNTIAGDIAEHLRDKGWSSGGDYQDDFLPDVEIATRAALDSFATSLPAARVPDEKDVRDELISFVQVGEVAPDGDIGRVTMYLPYNFIGKTVYLYDHAYSYKKDHTSSFGEAYWKDRAHAAEDKISSKSLMDVCRHCDECAPYLKEDETPAHRIERERKDVTACLRLLQIERTLTDINRLVDRFLAWPLPPSVCPDGCVMDSSYPHRIGTHLLTAEEAKAMFIHALGRDELIEASSKSGEMG